MFVFTPVAVASIGSDPPPTSVTNQSCGAVRAGLYDIEPEKLLVPDITLQDFEKAAKRTRPSVAPEELQRFTDWTAEFGMEG